MQRILAIVWLTWKAAFRFRLFLVVAALLLAAVVGLPLLLKDDGTAEGFTQILLTYTLGSITLLLGLSTLWLACGTLARDIEECQMQVVATKPIARWQIWLGKWLGIVSLNAVLLSLSGGAVYGMLQWRASRLPVPQQRLLREQVLLARSAAREQDLSAEISETAERLLRERLDKNPVASVDLPQVRMQILQQVKARYQVVPSGFMREWKIDLSAHRDSLQDQPLSLRIKFNAAARNEAGTFEGDWRIGSEQNAAQPPVWLPPMSLAPDTYHEFSVPSKFLDKNGVLTIQFLNRNDTALLFPLEDGLEVLYRDGSFGLNYLRGLGIIFCWMALLAALGLAAASFLSFPVAAFLAMGLLTTVLCSGTLSNAVAEGTIAGYNEETNQAGHSVLDVVMLPVFRALLTVIDMAKNYSPIAALSSGRSIPWSMLALAFGQVVLLLGGFFGLVGIWIFSRRELASGHNNQ